MGHLNTETTLWSDCPLGSFARRDRLKAFNLCVFPLSEGHILKKAVTTLGVIRPEVNLLYESSRNLFLSVSLHSNQADINVINRDFHNIPHHVLGQDEVSGLIHPNLRGDISALTRPC
jgi:hypothetical protein